MKLFFFILLASFPCFSYTFATPGDLEYLINREYERAATWNEKVLNLVDRKVETEDYIRFIEKPSNEYLKELLVRYSTISGSGIPFEETNFHRKNSCYKNAVEFEDPFYYKHLLALDYFLKLEFAGILCHADNDISDKDRYHLLESLWKKILEEQRLSKNIFEKCKQELHIASEIYRKETYKKNYETRTSESACKLEEQREIARLKFSRLLTINGLRSKSSSVLHATLRCVADLCENDPKAFFDFLERSGFSKDFFSSEDPRTYLILLLDAHRTPVRTSDASILRYFDENRETLKKNSEHSDTSKYENSTIKIPDNVGTETTKHVIFSTETTLRNSSALIFPTKPSSDTNNGKILTANKKSSKKRVL